MARIRSNSSKSSGRIWRARCCEMSSPRFRQASWARESGVSPSWWAVVDALSESITSLKPASRTIRRKIASAVGLRQILPVQTNKILITVVSYSLRENQFSLRGKRKVPKTSPISYRTCRFLPRARFATKGQPSGPQLAALAPKASRRSAMSSSRSRAAFSKSRFFACSIICSSSVRRRRASSFSSRGASTSGAGTSGPR